MSKTILTGIRPSGRWTLGNYLGAAKPASEMMNPTPEQLARQYHHEVWEAKLGWWENLPENWKVAAIKEAKKILNQRKS